MNASISVINQLKYSDIELSVLRTNYGNGASLKKASLCASATHIFYSIIKLTALQHKIYIFLKTKGIFFIISRKTETHFLKRLEKSKIMVYNKEKNKELLL